MAQELAALRGSLANVEVIRVLDREAYRGTIDGREVILVQSGVGKVASGMVAVTLLSQFHCRPLMISGVAGGLDPKLGIGDLVIGTQLVQHDYGHLTDKGIKPFKPGISPVGEPEQDYIYKVPEDVIAKLKNALAHVTLPSLPGDIVAGGRTPHLVFGTIASGDQFINSETKRTQLHAEFGAQAAEMEGASTAQAAELFGTYVINVRSMSDLCGQESHLDFPRFLLATAPVAADVVRRIAAVI
jgi:adenosylhomocysteine nucleosidase